jgi:AP2 domain/HNH endonuclease
MRKKYRVKRHAVTQPLDSSYRLIPLTNNQNAIVDAADFQWLSEWNWVAWWNDTAQSYYATRAALTDDNQKTTIYMHRVLAGEDGLEVDHKNGDSLDNRRNNLRPATKANNMRNRTLQANNTTGFKGVIRGNGKWVAQATFNGRRIYLGTFDTPELAARAFDAFAIEWHGDFARLNFPNSVGPVFEDYPGQAYFHKNNPAIKRAEWNWKIFRKDRQYRNRIA